ncbi:MAG: hypothetical protein EOL97_16835, partial [Spirochaetia bacterium]|nr:hypothetical protein [Spirochaetia bacterium]
MKSIWLMSDFIPKNLEDLKEFEEVCVINAFHKISKEDLLQKLKKIQNITNVRVAVNLHSEENEPIKTEDMFFDEIRFWKKNKIPVVLDYIREKEPKLSNLSKINHIKEIIAYAKYLQDDIKIAVWKFPNCFFVA